MKKRKESLKEGRLKDKKGRRKNRKKGREKENKQFTLEMKSRGMFHKNREEEQKETEQTSPCKSCNIGLLCSVNSPSLIHRSSGPRLSASIRKPSLAGRPIIDLSLRYVSRLSRYSYTRRLEKNRGELFIHLIT